MYTHIFIIVFFTTLKQQSTSLELMVGLGLCPCVYVHVCGFPVAAVKIAREAIFLGTVKIDRERILWQTCDDDVHCYHY